MNSTVVLIIIAIAVICVVGFVLFSRSKKAGASAQKEDPAAAGKHAQLAQDVLKAIGGKGNVTSVSYCATRLRFEVKNYAQVDEKAVKAAGATGVIRPGKNACQVIIGTNVKSVYDEMNKLLN